MEPKKFFLSLLNTLTLLHILFLQGGALLRIEPVRANRDEATYECVAENGVGDAVTAVASLEVYDCKFFLFAFFTWIPEKGRRKE